MVAMLEERGACFLTIQLPVLALNFLSTRQPLVNTYKKAQIVFSIMKEASIAGMYSEKPYIGPKAPQKEPAIQAARKQVEKRKQEQQNEDNS